MIVDTRRRKKKKSQQLLERGGLPRCRLGSLTKVGNGKRTLGSSGREHIDQPPGFTAFRPADPPGPSLTANLEPPQAKQTYYVLGLTGN